MSTSFKFFSWFSSSDSVGKNGTYLYSENINSLNPEYIEVSPKAQTLLTSEEKIDYLVFQVYPEKWKKDFAYVDKYKIFNQDKQVIYDHIAEYNIVNFNWFNNPKTHFYYRWLAIVIAPFWGNDYFYICWPGVAKEDTGNRFTELWFFTNHKSNWLPMWFIKQSVSSFNFHDVISVGYGTVLLTNSKLIQYWDYWEQLFSSPWYSAVSVNSSSNWFKVFSRDWKLRFIPPLESDKPKVSETYALDLKIISVKWYSWVDYIFATEWLFFLNGIVASPIAYTTSSNYLDFERFNFFYDLKWGYVRHDKFIYSITKTSKWFDLNVLGSSAVGSPINFSSIISKDNYEEISSMMEYRDWVLISYKDKNWTYWIDYFSLKNEEKNEKWYLITKEYVWDWQIFLKKAKVLKFFCDKLKENEYLKIYASINNGEFEEVKTLTKDDRWKNGYFEVLNFNKEFHKIVFKLELKWSFKLYDFIFLDDKIR